jgi:hypothetical protein
MDELETSVATYLTAGGRVFVAPQFETGDKTERNGIACPDFVALDFPSKEIVVVEVTASWAMSKVFRLVSERETRWYAPIRSA